MEKAYVAILVITFVGLYVYMKYIDPKINKKTTNTETVTNEKEQEELETQSNNYKNCYQRKYLFTKNELYAYKKLKELADKRELIICPKVRLLDIIEPRYDKKNSKALMWKIQAKHVDFLICDTSMRIQGIIELDDNSHKQIDRQERDRFVNEILEDVGYKIVRTKYITDTTLDKFVVKEENILQS